MQSKSQQAFFSVNSACGLSLLDSLWLQYHCTWHLYIYRDKGRLGLEIRLQWVPPLNVKLNCQKKVHGLIFYASHCASPLKSEERKVENKQRKVDFFFFFFSPLRMCSHPFHFYSKDSMNSKLVLHLSVHICSYASVLIKVA